MQEMITKVKNSKTFWTLSTMLNLLRKSYLIGFLFKLLTKKKIFFISLIGLSSISGAFGHEVLSRLAELNEQPIIFPLSNPSTQAECTFEQAMKATNDKVIFASGTAFPPYTIESTGEVRYPGQGNNMYIFPGLGLGACLARPKNISDRMIYQAAKALAESLSEEERAKGWLYPSLKRIRPISALVAAAVCQEAKDENLAMSEAIQKCQSHQDIVDYVTRHMWSPTNDSYGTDTLDSRI
jgi:malate dehydrogenase (oxaloacetate-decarboxylating)(NADP+)